MLMCVCATRQQGEEHGPEGGRRANTEENENLGKEGQGSRTHKRDKGRAPNRGGGGRQGGERLTERKSNPRPDDAKQRQAERDPGRGCSFHSYRLVRRDLGVAWAPRAEHAAGVTKVCERAYKAKADLHKRTSRRNMKAGRSRQEHGREKEG